LDHENSSHIVDKTTVKVPVQSEFTVHDAANGIECDTGSVGTYTVYMNVTLSIDEQVVARARKKAKALGKSLNELIRDYLQKLAGGNDPEKSIEEFEHLSGRGHSRGWRFNRDEIHERS
jgi:hypothetical protein